MIRNILDEDHGVECLDNYSNTKSKVDWIHVMCQNGLHVTCTFISELLE